jgi:hypothetical protein
MMFSYSFEFGNIFPQVTTQSLKFSRIARETRLACRGVSVMVIFNRLQRSHAQELLVMETSMSNAILPFGAKKLGSSSHLRTLFLKSSRIPHMIPKVRSHYFIVMIRNPHFGPVYVASLCIALFWEENYVMRNGDWESFLECANGN